MTIPTIECHKVSKRFGNVSVLDNLTLTVESGEILSVLGPSGAGKTTMLRTVAGFESLNSGEIRIQGELASSQSVHKPPELRQVGMVFQNYALFPHLTISKNIEFGIKKLAFKEQKRRLSHVLSLTKLTGLENRYPHELSGGQQQRVALARTLAPNPVVILLDEPFSNLDASLRLDVRREVGNIVRENRTTTIFVTHDREDSFGMADRVAVIREGTVDQIDPPDSLYHSPETPFVAIMSGAATFVSAEIQGDKAITEIGELPYTISSKSPTNNKRVMLLVRAHDFDLSPSSKTTCTVVAREFRGDEVMLTVKFASGATIQCKQHHSRKLEPTTHVDLTPSNPHPFLAFPFDSAFIGKTY
ncbi:MAG: ABC transporter ATP-binding protein [SAR202 cluster bacterium]|nr:ABC transporter ATP-binding protein [SAR202 cluster bacterium]